MGGNWLLRDYMRGVCIAVPGCDTVVNYVDGVAVYRSMHTSGPVCWCAVTIHVLPAAIVYVHNPGWGWRRGDHARWEAEWRAALAPAGAYELEDILEYHSN